MRVVRFIFLAAIAAPLAGCVTGPAGEPLRVPANAQLLAYGSPPPPFSMPKQAGKLYVFDDDQKTVALVTSWGPSQQAAGPIGLEQTPGFRQLYETKAHLRIYFVPDPNQPDARP